jgi:hypothetical protein
LVLDLLAVVARRSLLIPLGPRCCEADTDVLALAADQKPAESKGIAAKRRIYAAYQAVSA